MLDIKIVIGIIAAILGLIGYFPYIRDTLKGKTKPHVYTWFIWGLIALIIFSLQITDGAGPGSWVTLVASTLSFSIFILGIKSGDKNITKSDTFYFITALASLGIWILAKQPVLSIILLITVGILGFIPTVRKSWNEPYTETVSTYSINSFRHFLSFFALSQYTLVTWLFPISWGLANTLFVVFILIRRSIVNNKKI